MQSGDTPEIAACGVSGGWQVVRDYAEGLRPAAGWAGEDGEVTIEPCPNCGNEAQATSSGPGVHWVYCTVRRCEMSGPYAHTSAFAIAYWNRIARAAQLGLAQMTMREQEDSGG